MSFIPVKNIRLISLILQLDVIIELGSKINIFILEIFLVIGVVSLAGEIGKEILDATAKLIGIAAGSTILYNNWGPKPSDPKGESDKNKKDSNKQSTAKKIPYQVKPMRPQNNYQYSLFLPFILSSISQIGENSTGVAEFSYGVFLLSFIALFCFINVVFYFIICILIDKGDYENKYPKLKRIINYYKNLRLIFIVIDIILCLICLSILSLFSLLIILK